MVQRTSLRIKTPAFTSTVPHPRRANGNFQGEAFMFKSAIPVLHVSSATAAQEFYCRRLGFEPEFAYHPDDDAPDPSYIGLKRDGARLHVSSFSGDGISGGVVFLVVEDVDALYAELVRSEVRVEREPTNQSWGNREMYVNDPDGNRLRFVSSGPR